VSIWNVVISVDA